MLTQKDFDEIEKLIGKRLDEKFRESYRLLPSKEEFFNKMDEVVGELKAIREENTIIPGRLSDHEERITKLEDAHPH